MRTVQPKGARGSLKWIQVLVNRHPNLFAQRVREAGALPPGETIEWVSPLEGDDFAEYRDGSFLSRLCVELDNRALSDFWPRYGPQWDALGKTDSGGVLLVEAKANVRELVSDACGATSQASMARINDSLKETQEFLRVDPKIGWTGKLYQYANRIAHLYLLRELNGVQAHLVFVYFVGGSDVDGPATVGEWKAAINVVERVLGLPGRHRLSDYVADVFVDVSEFAPA